MTDAEWAVLEPVATEVMAQIRLAPGRPMDHPVRSMLDAVRYLVRNGIEWRAMPVDFPPYLRNVGTKAFSGDPCGAQASQTMTSRMS